MKRGGPLKRTTALAGGSSSLKRSRIRKRKPRGQPPERRDDAFKQFVRMLPCCAPLSRDERWIIPCEARPCDPHHEHGDGLGMKTHDRTCIPLCRRHHDDAEAKRGAFKGWGRERMREWHRAESARVVALYERTQGSESTYGQAVRRAMAEGRWSW